MSMRTVYCVSGVKITHSNQEYSLTFYFTGDAWRPGFRVKHLENALIFFCQNPEYQGWPNTVEIRRHVFRAMIQEAMKE